MEVCSVGNTFLREREVSYSTCSGVGMPKEQGAQTLLPGRLVFFMAFL